jgi:hypothetical protein
MYPYLKELTLGEALQLEQIAPDSMVFDNNPNQKETPDCINCYGIKFLYEDGYKLYCTPLDYATHILKQKTPPEGYGYAVYELSSRMYDELPYCFNFDKHLWRNSEAGFSSTRTVAKDWYEIAFRLTDLARVEGEPISKMETTVTDWEAKYKELEKATTSTLNTSHGQRSFGDYVNGYCEQLDLAERIADLEAKTKEKPTGHPNYQKELLERIAELEAKEIKLIRERNEEIEKRYDLEQLYNKLSNYVIVQLLSNQ